MKPLSSTNCKGQILILAVFAIVALTLAAGIGIDSGIGYGVKAKLNAATDAAVLAAGRAVSEGNTQEEQIASAEAAATKFFTANYPHNYLGSTPHLGATQVQFEDGEIIIDISATADVPTYFFRLVGINPFTVSASAQVRRKDLDMSFVVDVTDSLYSVRNDVKDAAELFISKFNASQDRVALITFADGSVINEPIHQVSRGFDKATVINKIRNLSFGGFTNFSEGLWNAREQLNSIASGNRSSHRVIVFFTDGSPNTFASTFTFTSRRPYYGRSHAGSVRTGSNSFGTPTGLWEYDQISTTAPSPYGNETCGYCDIRDVVSTLPDYYNPHDPSETEFRIVKNSPRRVTSQMSWTNVNRAARNLSEDMAAAARAEGIYVFTLGLGEHLTHGTGPDNERGDELLKRMANTEDSDTYDSGQPTGAYCYAATEQDLKPCFSRLASQILRLSM
jgi:Flp pilus assembly protein TadG